VNGRPSRETVMTALYSALQAGGQTTFTATTQAGSQVLTNPSTTTGLMVGVPVVGGSIPRGAIIQSLAPLTLSLPATANAVSASLLTGFQTFSRRLKHWSEVSAQPALFLRGVEEELDYPNIILQRQTIRAEIFIYSNAGEDPDLAPEIGLNNLLDAVQAVFTPDDVMRGRFTLGGLVEWCRMSGRIDKEPGDLGGQAIAIAEVEITVP